jgi:hypothetical protein
MRIAGTLLLLASIGACSGDDDDDECSGHACPVELPFLDFVTGDEVAGTTSTIVRSNDGVMTESHVVFPADQEGVAYSYWYIIFDDPTQCETTPCELADFLADRGKPAGIHFDGFVVDSSLEFDFSQSRTVDDGPANAENGDVIPGEAPWGLSDPQNAEIHVVLRTHGPELEDFETQVASLNGGCPPNTCANVYFCPHQASF